MGEHQAGRSGHHATDVSAEILEAARREPYAGKMAIKLPFTGQHQRHGVEALGFKPFVLHWCADLKRGVEQFRRLLIISLSPMKDAKGQDQIGIHRDGFVSIGQSLQILKVKFGTMSFLVGFQAGREHIIRLQKIFIFKLHKPMAKCPIVWCSRGHLKYLLPSQPEHNFDPVFAKELSIKAQCAFETGFIL